MLQLLLPIFGGLVLFGIITLCVGLPGRALRTKFVSMGALQGKSKSQIVSVVGGPNAVSQVGAGKTVLQWLATGYHISLIFNGDVCEGVSHEYWRGY